VHLVGFIIRMYMSVFIASGSTTFRTFNFCILRISSVFGHLQIDFTTTCVEKNADEYGR